MIIVLASSRSNLIIRKEDKLFHYHQGVTTPIKTKDPDLWIESAKAKWGYYKVVGRGGGELAAHNLGQLDFELVDGKNGEQFLRGT